MGYVILYNPGEKDSFSSKITSNDVEEPCENIGWIVHTLQLESYENLAEMALHLVSIGAVCYINILCKGSTKAVNGEQNVFSHNEKPSDIKPHSQ